MRIIYLIIMTIIGFGLLILGNKRWKYSTIYAITIGAVVGANVYNATNYPIMLGNLPFGMDSVVYTLFVFGIIYMLISFGKKDAYVLMFSSIAAIIFAALVQFLTESAIYGISDINIVKTFLGYIGSAVATLIAIYFMILIFIRLKNKNINIYLSIFICLIFASIVNSAIYFGVNAILGNSSTNFGYMLLASYIGKIFASIISLITYYILQKNNNKNT